MYGLTYQEKNPHSHVRVTLTYQGQYVNVKKHKNEDAQISSGGGKRGIVTHFTRDSRKRMIDQCAKLDRQKIESAFERPLFITLTYVKNMRNGKEAKRHLEMFAKRLKRIRKNMSFIWRMEYQQRGSIHFHLMVFGLGFQPIHTKNGVTGLQDHWSQVTGENSKNSLDVEKIKSVNGVVYYVAKYMAKDTLDDEGETDFVKARNADRDASSTNATQSPNGDGKTPRKLSQRIVCCSERMHHSEDAWVCDVCGKALSSLGLSIPHKSPQADSDSETDVAPGRFWGVYGRKHLPVGEKNVFTSDMTYNSYRTFTASIESEYSQPFFSFTIYTANADEIVNLFDRVWMFHMEENAQAYRTYQEARIFWCNYNYLERTARRMGYKGLRIDTYTVPDRQRLKRDMGVSELTACILQSTQAASGTWF